MEAEQKVPNTLAKYKNWEFTSGHIIDEDFRVFSRLFKKYINAHIPIEANLINFNRGHYYISGFIEKQDRYVYFSISDVRFFSGGMA